MSPFDIRVNIPITLNCSKMEYGNKENTHAWAWHTKAAAIFISYAEFPSDKALESLQMFHDLGNIYS
jgi:hypothetical protein